MCKKLIAYEGAGGARENRFSEGMAECVEEKAWMLTGEGVGEEKRQHG